VTTVVASRDAVAVIAHFDPQLVGGILKRDVGLGRMCVPERVGETFLDYPVGRDVDPAGQLEGITADVQPHGESGAPDLLQQRVETVEPRLGSELGGFPVFPHRVQQVTHLCQCGAPWEESFIGVRHFNCYGRRRDGESAICPRCIVAPLSVGFLIEHEIALAVGSSDDYSSAETRRNITERYARFLT